MSTNLKEGSILNFKNVFLNGNVFLDGNVIWINKIGYDIHIDEGTVLIYRVLCNITLESTNITIDSKTYYFDQYSFKIWKSRVLFGREEIIDINQFILNVTRGRINILGKYYSFTINNNILTVGKRPNYSDFDLRFEQNVTRRQYVYESLLQINANRHRIPNDIEQEFNLRHPQYNNHLKQIADNRQNVHDSYILNHLQQIIIKIIFKTEIIKSIDQTMEELTTYIIKRESKSKSWLSKIFKYIFNIIQIDSQTIKTIDYIKRNNGYINKFDMTELQVLQLIWNAIYNNEDLKNILYLNIKDMYTNHAHVCLTGRVTRMIDIFSGINDEFTNNKKNLRKEMLNRCAQIRKELDEDDDHQSIIKKRLMTEYVGGDILSLDEFNKEVEEWIDHI